MKMAFRSSLSQKPSTYVGSPFDRACGIFYDAYMCFQCRWREVDSEEPPGAEASGTVGLHGSFQNKQRSPRGYQLARTVRSPLSSAALASCPSLLPSVLSAFSSDYTSHVLQPPAAHRRLLWQQGPQKCGAALHFSLPRTLTYI